MGHGDCLTKHQQFDKIASYFSTDDGYWKHTQNVLEVLSVENLIAKSWIDNLSQIGQQRYKE